VDELSTEVLVLRVYPEEGNTKEATTPFSGLHFIDGYGLKEQFFSAWMC